MKVLWVLPKWTFPVNDGARHASFSLLSQLKGNEIDFDVLAIVPDKEECDIEQMQDAVGSTETFLINRTSAPTFKKKLSLWLSSFFKNPSIPLTASYFYSSTIHEPISCILRAKQYDVIVLDGFHLAFSFLPFMKSFSGNMILRSHNIESDLWFKKAERMSFPMSTFCRWQGNLFQKWEKKILALLHKTLPISQTDLQTYQQWGGGVVELIPLGLPFLTSRPQLLPHDNRLLFLGRLDWAPNKDGLKWFLDYVWPKALSIRSDLKLRIVGSGDSDWLHSYAALPGVEIIGRVERVAPFFEWCSATIAPLFYGSGTRIKIVESVAHNRCVITTQLGVQGTSLCGEEFFLAQGIDDWVNTLVGLNKQDAFAKTKAAKEKLEREFDRNEIGRQLVESLKT